MGYLSYKLYRLFLSPHSLSVTTVTLGSRLFFIRLQINLLPCIFLSGFHGVPFALPRSRSKQTTATPRHWISEPVTQDLAVLCHRFTNPMPYWISEPVTQDCQVLCPRFTNPMPWFTNPIPLYNQITHNQFTSPRRRVIWL